MAVKLLSSMNSIFPLKVTCTTCGALLEIESAKDVIINYPTRTTRIPMVNCPECGNVVSIDGENRAKALVERDRRGEWRNG